MVEILFDSFATRFAPSSLFPWKAKKKELECSLLRVATDYKIWKHWNQGVCYSLELGAKVHLQMKIKHLFLL